MAKYLVTSGSHFTPFTYDELVKPVAHMQQAHDVTQEAYDTLNMETSALRNYITDNPEDSRARAMYDNYMDKLNTLQNNLWEHGYNAQTRRDLSAARSAYASDITRLGIAIKNRQERSKEYWDMRHKNPDLVMGADPGLAGLNNYLDNDRYGQDFYSYSGLQFMKEVGADAQARAAEMLQKPEIIRNPELAGYLTVIRKKGFSNQQVSDATAAVRMALQGGRDNFDDLETGTGILANVLMSHLNSSGAANAVDPTELDRLVGYGSQGLAQAVGGIEERELSDKKWDLAARLAGSGSGSSGNKSGKKGGIRPGGYALSQLSGFLGGDAANADVRAANGILQQFEKPIRVTMPDGNIREITNSTEAEEVLSSLGRDEFMNKYGVNPDNPGGKITIKDEYGKTRTGNVILSESVAKTGHITRAVPSDYNQRLGIIFDDENNKTGIKRSGARDSQKEDDAKLIDEFNRDLSAYRNKVNQFNASNPGVNLVKLSMSDPISRENYYKKNRIPETVAWEDVPAYLTTRANMGRFTGAVIADNSSNDYMKKARADFAANIIEQWDVAPKEDKKGKKVYRTGESGFYPIDPNNRGIIPEEAVQTKVLENPDDLQSVRVYPEDLLGTRPMVRVVVKGKEYAVRPSMLGTGMETTFRHLKEDISPMMLPLTRPELALNMTDEQAVNWINLMDYMLGDYMPFIATDDYDNIIGAVSPAMIVHNQGYQDMLRKAITNYMNHAIAESRDYSNEYHPVSLGNSDSRWSPYNFMYR